MNRQRRKSRGGDAEGVRGDAPPSHLTHIYIDMDVSLKRLLFVRREDPK